MQVEIELKKIFPLNGEKNCEFILGASNSKQFPVTNFCEFALIGASNVGKSSLINSLTKQKIAITSNMPGRTRQINFFLLAEKIMLVDMPGFGFAKANKKEVENWQRNSFEYFATRKQLQRVFFLIDPVKGLKEADCEMANIFNSLGVSFQIVLTKIDKIKPSQVQETIVEIENKIKSWPSAYPSIILTSSKNGDGLKDLKLAMIEVFCLAKL